MTVSFPPKSPEKPRILVAPLDWGLGHATRCIPIIKALLVRGCEVFIAGEGAQASILQESFPGLATLPLQGYRIQYSKNKKSLAWKIFFQIPGIKKTIEAEGKWLEEMVGQYEFDAVISDNRYGLHHKSIHNIFITHQLAIKTGFGKFSERIIQKINYRYINKFSACWIPDEEKGINLGGELSHPDIKPAVPLKYLGIISRLQQKEGTVRDHHLLFILSGPEPQRTIFENMIIDQVSHYNYTCTIVRGLPGSASILPSTNMISILNHADVSTLATLISEASLVICRSGYSSVMDLLSVQKKCIFIPTPGQTEQEYLGKYLEENKMGICIEQEKFSLTAVLEKAARFNYQIPFFKTMTGLEQAIDELLSAVKPVQSPGVALG